jgi:hypothetical protein
LTLATGEVVRRLDFPKRWNFALDTVEVTASIAAIIAINTLYLIRPTERSCSIAVSLRTAKGARRVNPAVNAKLLLISNA